MATIPASILEALLAEGVDPSTVTLTTFDQLPWEPMESGSFLSLDAEDLGCAEDALTVLLPGWYAQDMESGVELYVGTSDLIEAWEIAADAYEPSETSYDVSFRFARCGIVLCEDGSAEQIRSDWETEGSVTIEPEAPECTEGEHSWGEWGIVRPEGAGFVERRVCARCSVAHWRLDDRCGNERTWYE